MGRSGLAARRHQVDLGLKALFERIAGIVGGLFLTLLGSGDANFDAHFLGNATSSGVIGNNIMSELAGCQGGVFAFMQGPISDGWTTKRPASSICCGAPASSRTRYKPSTFTTSR